MKRRTTTAQINEALTNRLLSVTRVECYHKTSRITDLIKVESFKNNGNFVWATQEELSKKYALPSAFGFFERKLSKELI